MATLPSPAPQANAAAILARFAASAARRDRIRTLRARVVEALERIETSLLPDEDPTDFTPADEPSPSDRSWWAGFRIGAEEEAGLPPSDADREAWLDGCHKGLCETTRDDAFEHDDADDIASWRDADREAELYWQMTAFS